VPIDYRLSLRERDELYNKLNGVYVSGDSHLAVTDEFYQTAFMQLLMYSND
jgi:hypothetical protein